MVGAKFAAAPRGKTDKASFYTGLERMTAGADSGVGVRRVRFSVARRCVSVDLELRSVLALLLASARDSPCPRVLRSFRRSCGVACPVFWGICGFRSCVLLVVGFLLAP